MVAYDFNPSIWEQRQASLRGLPAYVSQIGLNGESLSQKTENKTKTPTNNSTPLLPTSEGCEALRTILLIFIIPLITRDRSANLALWRQDRAG